ncbi:hypothetical protein AX17_002136 [Amanita inopinata Kibby_2008]|nr:hypothetical protein AX17_002136 [Amanita inopinata Kibby_2008]
MPLGHTDIPPLMSPEDYQANAARIEQARALLDRYAAMNEEARMKYEQVERDLARRVEEGERAKQELEMLRQRNTSLAITAPQRMSMPQVITSTAIPLHSPSTAKIEEVSSHSGEVDQRNARPSSSRGPVQADRWRMQTQASYPYQAYYNNVTSTHGLQTQPEIYTGHYPASRSSHPKLPNATTQPSTRNQIHQRPQPAQERRRASQINTGSTSASFGQAVQSARMQKDLVAKVPQQATSQPIRQQQSIPQGYTQPTSTVLDIDQQKSRQYTPYNVVTSSLAGALGQSAPLIGVEATKRSTVSTSTVSDVTSQSFQHTNVLPDSIAANVPMQFSVPIQPSTTKFTANPGTQAIPEAPSYIEILQYLRENHARWMRDMPPNSFLMIPATSFYLFKQSNSTMHLAAPNAKGGYDYMDLELLMTRTGVTSQMGVQSQSHIARQPLAQQPTPETVDLEATRHAPKPIVIPNLAISARVQSETTDITHTAVPTVATPSLPMPEPSSSRGIADAEPTVTPMKRTPAEADKKHLARDILRALGYRTAHVQPVSSEPLSTTQAEADNRHLQHATVHTTTDIGAHTTISGTTITPSTPAPFVPTPVVTAEAPNLRPPVASEDVPKAVTASVITESRHSMSEVQPVVVPKADEQSTGGPLDAMDIDEPNLPSTRPSGVNTVSPSHIQQDPRVASPSVESQQTSPGHNGLHNKLATPDSVAVAPIAQSVSAEVGQEVPETYMMQEDVEREEEVGQVVTIQESNEVQQVEGDMNGLGQTSKEQVANEEQVTKMPLFLPSPSSSRQSSAPPPPDTDIPDDSSMAGSGEDSVRQRETAVTKQDESAPSRYRSKKEVYVLVPKPPRYLVEFKRQEARQRKRQKLMHRSNGNRDRINYSRSASEGDTTDSATKMVLRESATRLSERRCKWNGCDAILNSSQRLFEHIRRQHCPSSVGKEYVLCLWPACGSYVSGDRLEGHLTSHTLFPLRCAYNDCEETFRVIQPLLKHYDAKHKGDGLKANADPFIPPSQEPPSISGNVPAYMIDTCGVLQGPISKERHALLGPWVYKNIAGPVNLTKRYNAAQRPPQCDFLTTSATQFSMTPSQPSKLRDMDDLHSVEVSNLFLKGLVIWPEDKKVPLGIAENELKEEDVFGRIALVTPTEVKQEEACDTVLFTKPPSAAQSSEEEDVAMMLTEP